MLDRLKQISSDNAGKSSLEGPPSMQIDRLSGFDISILKRYVRAGNRLEMFADLH